MAEPEGPQWIAATPAVMAKVDQNIAHRQRPLTTRDNRDYH